MAGNDRQISQGKPQQSNARAARLKAALKANLARRKEQARARAPSADDETPATTGQDDDGQ
ncbi:hypothetical protein [uncultured Roseicyclus sp.]|jgi:hypothetical protein|uniref:hypothetical protein n=1 Tax=uncultured Roseicyclus sp. TaxID=543072 RepID=UPI00262A6B9F|nr:hypothetical protein [uncultured Roseicyclus sp.]